MKIFVGVTDNEWYDHLSHLPQVDEVNFWQPSADLSFKALKQGELFLFKLHSPRNYIAGGGVFAYSTTLPISLAWETFKEKNGARSYEEMRKRIVQYRRSPDNRWEDFHIGCIVLTQPFFFDESLCFTAPEWHQSIVRGKTYALDSEAGRMIWQHLFKIWEQRKIFDLDREARRIEEERARYGKETTIRPRLGQGAFKIAVTDAYGRACAITEEHSLPALEAAHIKPFNLNGPNAVYNGLLLRSDVHRLFDSGYITVTPELQIDVSRRLREEFENGRYYYPFHGNKIRHLPTNPSDHPAKDLLIWHNENIYRR